MKRSQYPSTAIDPTQPAAPRAAFEDRSAVPATPQISLTPPRHGVAAAPAGSAAYSGQTAPKQQPLRDLKQRASAAVTMTKHASDAGLAGVAEAAGHLIGELTPASKWRQDVLQIRLAAGLTLTILLGYTLFLAPRKLGFWGELALVLRGCSDNALSFALFNMLGVMPAILACVAWPALRNKNYKSQPIKPYLVASFATGAFAFLSHIARWNPSKTSAPLPPTRLSGSTAWLQRLSESRLLPATLLASTFYFYIFPFIATPATWAHFGYLFTHSLTVHVMMIDFSLLTLMSPWLVIRDAAARGWGFVHKPAGRWILGSAMLAAPAVGPAVYLLLRPISSAGYDIRSLCKDIVSVLLRPRGLLPGVFRRQQQQGGTQAYGRGSGDTTAAAEGPTEVEAAAAIPLPSAPVLAASAAVGMLSDAWDRSCLWIGQQIARMRGGGAAVATSDEVRDDEHDIDGGDYAAAPDTVDTEVHSSGTALHTFAHALGDFLHRHQQHQKHLLGPGQSPKKTPAPNGGVELEFSEDYDEFDADTSTDSSDDENDSISDLITDTDDDSDDMDLQEEGFDDKPATGALNGGLSSHYAGVNGPEVEAADDDELFASHPQGLRADAQAAVGVGHGRRSSKELAFRRLAELGHQVHPRMPGTTV